MADEQEDPSDGADISPMLPLIPTELGVDPLLAALLQCAAFLDLSADDLVDGESATEVLEHVGLYIQRLGSEELAQVADQLAELKEHGQKVGWSAPAIEFIDDFLYSCGIGEDVSE
jgi:hypothetical protein